MPLSRNGFSIKVVIYFYIVFLKSENNSNSFNFFLLETFGDRVIAFNNSLHYKGILPPGIGVMNPFIENKEAMEASREFYHRYYNDNNVRHILIGINPGRFGAGQTGVPFTDPIRLREVCGIPYHGGTFREASSVFIYEMIAAYGGVKEFYGKFFISALSPLGFTQLTAKGNAVNHNYYDSKELKKASYPFIIDCLKKQLSLGINRETAVCLGIGKNFEIFKKINTEHGFFKEIIPLEHPRYIIQYKSKFKEDYIDKYIKTLKSL